MPEQRHVFRLHRSLVVALPLAVRQHLEVEPGQPVYWFTVRRGEAVLTKDAQRAGGRPEGLSLARELQAARAEIAHLKQRNEARDRSMYAEGYSIGFEKAQEDLTRPHGPSASARRRRRLYAYTFPEAAKSARAPSRRPARRRVETVIAPVLEDGPARSGEPPIPRRRSSPTLLDGIARDVLAGIAERRIEALEEQHTPRSDL